MDFTMQGLLIGLFAIAIGLAFAFYGFRVFLVLLPIWGFFAGFVLGAAAMDALFPDSGFLVEVSSWVIGFIIGIVFAVLSYLYYWVAIILLGGVLGYQLTYGVFQWIGFENAETASSCSSSHSSSGLSSRSASCSCACLRWSSSWSPPSPAREPPSRA